MSFVLEHPPGRDAARAYAAAVVFRGWLGLDVALQPVERVGWCLRDRGGAACLVMPDSFFEKASLAWLQPHSVPNEGMPRWRPSEAFPGVALIEPELPLIAAQAHSEGGYWRLSEAAGAGREGWLGLDVLGSVFFLLSRYEEVAAPKTDVHDRFPASASLAAREGFLERPLLDEYVEVMWAAMEQLWPGLRRSPASGRVRYTCDVDAPYNPATKVGKVFLRELVGDIVKRRSPARALETVAALGRGRREDYFRDRNNTFDSIMDICEAAGLNGAFYIISGHSAGRIDGCYRLDEPFILKLLRRIHDRGHEIGLHGSYNSFRDGAVLREERAALRGACEAAGAQANASGNRQHYLRWDSAVTPGLLAEAGFEYDTTGSFADRPGFRYGTARSFAMWDWCEGRALALRQQPLVVMECSVIAPRYLGLGYSEAALEKMQTLKSRALRYGGDFTLLWHNSHLNTPHDWLFLRELVTDRAWGAV